MQQVELAKADGRWQQAYDSPKNMKVPEDFLQQQMQMGIIPKPKQKVKKEWKEVAKEKMNYDVDVCPCCKAGTMITLVVFDAHGPPEWAVYQWNKQQQAITKKHLIFFNAK